MNAKRWLVGGIAIAVLSASPAFAAELFMEAPPLEVAEWVKGKPVNISEGKGKNVYVVEFWATWCGPCKASIPHLTEVQKKYKDKGVIIVGVSVDGDETVKNVKGFVKDMGSKMDYNVAIDDDGATNKTYMKAFKANGIPHAFVINKDGAIAWEGHPTFPEGRMEKVLDRILDGVWDKDAAKKEAKESKDSEAKAMKDMREKAMNQQKMVMGYLGSLSKDKSDAELGRKLLKDYGDNAQIGNMIAWTILANKNVKHRDMELAMKFAKAAYDASEGKEAAIVDTYARALYDNGKKDEAIKMQEKAIELASAIKGAQGKQLKAQLNEALENYKAGKPGIMEDQPLPGAKADADDDDDDDAPKDKKKKADDDDDE